MASIREEFRAAFDRSKFAVVDSRRGGLTITYEGVPVGFIIRRKRDWYGEMVLDGVFVNQHGRSRKFVGDDLPREFLLLCNNTAGAREMAEDVGLILGFMSRMTLYTGIEGKTATG